MMSSLKVCLFVTIIYFIFSFSPEPSKEQHETDETRSVLEEEPTHVIHMESFKAPIELSTDDVETYNFVITSNQSSAHPEPRVQLLPDSEVF